MQVIRALSLLGPRAGSDCSLLAFLFLRVARPTLMSRAAVAKTAQAHLRFIMDRTAVQHIGALRAPGELAAWKARVDRADTAEQLALCLSTYMNATADAPFSQDMLVVRSEIISALLGIQTLAQVAALIVKYRTKVIAAGLQAVRDAAPRRSWQGKGGAAGTSSFATDVNAVQNALRRPFQQRMDMDKAALQCRAGDNDRQRATGIYNPSAVVVNGRAIFFTP